MAGQSAWPKSRACRVPTVISDANSLARNRRPGWWHAAATGLATYSCFGDCTGMFRSCWVQPGTQAS